MFGPKQCIIQLVFFPMPNLILPVAHFARFAHRGQTIISTELHAIHEILTQIS